MKKVFSRRNFKAGVLEQFDFAVLTQLLKIITSLPENPTEGREGGSIAVMYNNQLAVRSIGKIPKEKEDKYFFNATEKIIRMVKNQERRSFQSRNESLDQYGGGIWHDGLYVSFSGFPEYLDESLAMAYALYICSTQRIPNTTTDEKFTEIIFANSKGTIEKDFSDNTFMLPVLETFIPWVNEYISLSEDTDATYE